MKELAPGFRFYPTEEELVSFYLHNKLQGREDFNAAVDRVIPVLHFFDFNPWDLPQLSGEICRRDPDEQWFFFNPRQKREVHGGKPKRTTPSGYWKSTGSPVYVYSSNNLCIGLKKSMVFYDGRIPDGRKTDWKLNEYKAIQGRPSSSSSSTLRQEFSLCRLYKTSNRSRRAFDRRPVGVEIREPRTQQVPPEEVRISQQNPPLMVDANAESSNPQDYGPPSQTGDINMSMDLGNEPLWDWEDLYNWYDNGEDQMFGL